MIRHPVSRARDCALRAWGFLICLAVVLGLATPAEASFLYQATNLGTPPGAQTTGAVASGINDAGEIVGSTADQSQAFVDTPSAGFSYLPLPAGATSSSANAVNDRGEVVGMYGTSTGGAAFSYTPAAGFRPLGSLGTQSGANAVNDFGEIVGLNEIGGHGHAVAYFPSGRIRDLGTLPGGDFSIALGVSDRGEIVGAASTAGDTGTDAFAYTPATGMLDLGRLPGTTFCAAYGVNDAGDVVGYCESPPGTTTTAFEYTPATGMLPLLPLLGGSNVAAAINNLGQIVGFFANHAFVYTRSAGMRDLGTVPGTTSGEAIAISGNGKIAGDSATKTPFGPPPNVGLWQPTFTR